MHVHLQSKYYLHCFCSKKNSAAKSGTLQRFKISKIYCSSILNGPLSLKTSRFGLEVSKQWTNENEKPRKMLTPALNYQLCAGITSLIRLPSSIMYINTDTTLHYTTPTQNFKFYETQRDYKRLRDARESTGLPAMLQSFPPQRRTEMRIEFSAQCEREGRFRDAVGKVLKQRCVGGAGTYSGVDRIEELLSYSAIVINEIN